MRGNILLAFSLVLCLLATFDAPRSQAADDSTTGPASTSLPASLPSDKPVAQHARGDLYYLVRCPQDDRMLGTRGDPVPAMYDGRHVRFCSSACRDAFEADLPGSFSRLDQKLAADQGPLYASDRSLVSNRPLGNAPLEFIWCNRLIRVNDASERDTFLADPLTYLDRQNEQIIAHRGPLYTIRGCPVQGTHLEKELDEQLTVVIAHRIIRVCCPDCAELVREVPWQYLPLIDYSIRHPEKN